MPVFEVRGFDSRGNPVKDVFDADSEKALKLQLKREGIFIEQIIERGSRATRRGELDLTKYFERITIADLSIVTRQLSTLIKAGIPLVDSITALVDQTSNIKFKQVLSDIKNKLNEGSNFADALSHYPNIFSNLYVNMVRAGETSGTLEIVLERIADYTENQARLRAKIMGALTYPVIMLLVAIGIISFLFVAVVPKITRIFEEMRASLPLPTKVLIAISSFIRDYWWLIFILLGMAIYFAIKYIKSPRGRVKFDSLMLRAPIIGEITRMLAMARFSRTLSTLLRSGVPILQSLDIVKNILNNQILISALEEARNSIREGESIAIPLKKSGQFPPLVIHMIAVGEKSGQLEDMLNNVADTYDYQVDAKLSALTSLLEPVMILSMGAVIFFMVISILLPILQLNEFIK
ncbi:MAG: type II secretion system inner membrane protein GspF [Deltaproteobacteria bacterium]|nr:type II secretion system inner membrane protein GspF [Deltaproteobacteria bacterium]